MPVAELNIYDKHGERFSVKRLVRLLSVSHTWVIRNQKRHPTVEGLIRQSEKIKRHPKKVGPRINIDDIPVGSWEAKLRCPPASTKTVSQVHVELNHEADFKLAKHIDSQRVSKKRRNRNDTSNDV